MDIERYINEAIFEEKEQHKCFYQLIWDHFKEDGFVVTDESGYEIDNVGMTVSLIDDQQKELIDQLLLLRSESERFMYEAFQYLIRARRREI